MTKRVLSVALKAAIVIAACVGLEMSLRLFSSEPNLTGFRYFTNLSNIYVAAVTAAELVMLLCRPKAEFPAALKGSALLCIMLTMLVAHFMLGGFTMGGTMAPSLMLLHYVVPILTLIDTLVFFPKGRMKAYYPFLWAVPPIIYLIVTMIICSGGAFSPKYPYPFLNIDELGIKNVTLTIIVLVILYMAAGYILYAIDRAVAKRSGNA